MLSKPGIVKSASLDFHQFKSRSKLFKELKTILNDCICMLQFPLPEHHIQALIQLHNLVCSLTKDNTTLSKSVFEATQLDEKLFIMETLCIFLKSHPPFHESSAEKKDLWARQTDLCLSIIQGVACFCPETTGYFLDVTHLKILIDLFSCKQPKVVLNALETIQIILGTSPEHLRVRFIFFTTKAVFLGL
ncbi:hypothetical protein DSO57_1032208 [Entomophthora muscae]|uniref:Uncharacterized protein n=1 Tax=Entomophthora muscae TaxID=34485 RepID=A0ACC2SDA7_9FUNG|nr:hypothetical protein DSO57_1032208 [Entomophthora muscae]